MLNISFALITLLCALYNYSKSEGKIVRGPYGNGETRYFKDWAYPIAVCYSLLCFIIFSYNSAKIISYNINNYEVLKLIKSQVPIYFFMASTAFAILRWVLPGRSRIFDRVKIYYFYLIIFWALLGIICTQINID
jgi:hypothetical protein